MPTLTTDRPHSTPSPDATASGFYTASEAARIARVPRARLRAWRREGVIHPSLCTADEEGNTQIGYTFEDLAYLRLLRLLRDRGISLERAVRALQHLRERFGPPGAGWATARIWVQGRDVFVEGADTWEITTATRGGQQAAQSLLGEDFAAMRERADALLVPREYHASVEIDPGVRSGQPVVRHTSIPTAVIHRLHQRGLDTRRIREAYPHLSPAQIKGALAFEHFLDEAATG